MATPQPLPPLSAEFESSVDPGHTGAAPQKYGWKLSRCSNGKSIVDYGNKTVITDPHAQQSITLDHVKKEALVVPLPAAQGKPGGTLPSPQAPASQAPPIQVKDLGKKLIGGHEAEGKLYTFQPPQLPQLPGVKPPQMPQAPGGTPAQGMPAPGKPPMQAPQLPHTVETWTSSKLHLPLLTKSSGSSGQQTTTCKQVTAGEPPPSTSQIPPDYKVVHPPMPSHAPPNAT